ncbi:MAG TPA: molybdenum cofactor biosynthesis protein MoaE [Rhizomicrobium sp.]|jgi:molybdopterin synthase catalytic subunit|nr:molybdenum cofactor biosynthesis protein MoaE [Rhizomicrobium sp.]
MSANIHIQVEDFDVSEEIDALTREQPEGTGAVATFTGYVRGDGGLSALRLEHYPGMTEREIARIAAEAGTRWPLSGVTIIHRVGRLKVGERIVLVAVASSHRAAAFAACEFLMDFLKTRAPFWKEEERGGGAQWVEAKSSDDAAAERWRKA